eukprot:gene10868-12683_t
MEDDTEPSLVYDLTQSHKTCSVLSLKANSRLLKDLQAQDGQASIVFTSTTSARVTVGTEEYDLTFCDTKRTDAYEEAESGEMALLGEVQGRLQVTSSRSNGVKEVAPLPTAEKLNLYPELEPKKREISLLEVGASMSGLVSTNQKSVDSYKKPKLSHSTTPVITPGTQTKRKPVSSHTLESSVLPAQPSFDLTTSLLLLGNISVEVAASDIMSSLFSGLGVAAMYVCRHAGQELSMQTSSIGNACVEATSTVDLYVEFNSLGGAELAMMRDGEQLSYKSMSTPATTADANNNSTNSSTLANAATSSSSTSNAKATFTRKSVIPVLQPVDTHLAFWVKHVGLRLFTPGMQSTSNLTSSTPIKRYIETVLDTLQTIHTSDLSTAGTTNTLVEDVLHDPVVLARRWQPVVSQLLLTSGCMDAYSTDHTLRVRVRKDTNYLFRNPAVADILLAHISPSMEIIDATRTENNENSFLQDQGSEGLYSVDEDVQLRKFKPFLLEAEQNVQHCEAMWRYTKKRGA